MPCKKDYYSSKIAGQKFNPKKVWKTINNLLGRQNKPTVVNEINLGGKNFTTPKDIAVWKFRNKIFAFKKITHYRIFLNIHHSCSASFPIDI